MPPMATATSEKEKKAMETRPRTIASIREFSTTRSCVNTRWPVKGQRGPELTAYGVQREDGKERGTRRKGGKNARRKGVSE
eukprot:76742-Rhodomonas_salina.6